MTARYGTYFREMTLQEVCHDSVLNAPNGRTSAGIAADLGMSRNALLTMFNPNEDGHHPRLGHLAPLMKATGSKAPAAWLANAAGGAFVDMDAVCERVAGGTRAG